MRNPYDLFFTTWKKITFLHNVDDIRDVRNVFIVQAANEDEKIVFRNPN